MDISLLHVQIGRVAFGYYLLSHEIVLGGRKESERVMTDRVRMESDWGRVTSSGCRAVVVIDRNGIISGSFCTVTATHSGLAAWLRGKEESATLFERASS